MASDITVAPANPRADTLERPRRGAEVLPPLGSVFVPGLGQYAHGEVNRGFAYSAAAIGGAIVASTGDADGESWVGDLPRRPRDQFAEQGDDVAFTAGFLSAWDSFHAAVPALQQQGKYLFLNERDGVGDLVTAPFDFRFLRRWTTWVDLAQTVAITALVVADRDRGVARHPFRGHDALYAASASMNAAVGEEAAFRGWLLPVFHQHTGQRFAVANGIQGALFGAAHLPDAGWYAAFIGGWAVWEGWVTKRNGWSVRESVFHHFWYDAAVFTAALATQNRDVEARFTFPMIRFKADGLAVVSQDHRLGLTNRGNAQSNHCKSAWWFGRMRQSRNAYANFTKSELPLLRSSLAPSRLSV